MSDHGSSLKAISYAFFANLGIALAKLAAALYTHSGSMLAEAIHSFADCGNQVLLFIGLKQAQKPPDAKHPLGYGARHVFLELHGRAAAVLHGRPVLHQRGLAQAARRRAAQQGVGRLAGARRVGIPRVRLADRLPARDQETARRTVAGLLGAQHAQRRTRRGAGRGRGRAGGADTGVRVRRAGGGHRQRRVRRHRSIVIGVVLVCVSSSWRCASRDSSSAARPKKICRKR